MRKIIWDPLFFVGCMIVSVLVFLFFMLAEGVDRPSVGSKNIQIETFTVSSVGICTGGRYSTCAYTVSNPTESWNISMPRPMGIGWTVSRTRWTTLMGNDREVWN